MANDGHSLTTLAASVANLAAIIAEEERVARLDPDNLDADLLPGD